MAVHSAATAATTPCDRRDAERDILRLLGGGRKPPHHDKGENRCVLPDGRRRRSGNVDYADDDGGGAVTGPTTVSVHRQSKVTSLGVDSTEAPPRSARAAASPAAKAPPVAADTATRCTAFVL